MINFAPVFTKVYAILRQDHNRTSVELKYSARLGDRTREITIIVLL